MASIKFGPGKDRDPPAMQNIFLSRKSLAKMQGTKYDFDMYS